MPKVLLAAPHLISPNASLSILQVTLSSQIGRITVCVALRLSASRA
jgi:hypothetical protein